jgi:hypothetical protein
VPYDTGIADRLRAEGRKVVEVAGWQTRGSSTFHPQGSVDHHTGGARAGNAPSLGTVINGRPGLPGPLCNVFIARDNTCYVVAAGRANHAGAGGWLGRSGNSQMFGVERENVGTPVEPWTPAQTDNAARTHAALIRGITDPRFVCEHKEWAPKRKVDAHTITGPEMRQKVLDVLYKQPQGPQEGWLMALTDEQQETLRKQVDDLHKWFVEGVPGYGVPPLLQAITFIEASLDGQEIEGRPTSIRKFLYEDVRDKMMKGLRAKIDQAVSSIKGK